MAVSRNSLSLYTALSLGKSVRHRQKQSSGVGNTQVQYQIVVGNKAVAVYLCFCISLLDLGEH